MNGSFAILPDRVKAVVVDSVIVIAAMYAVSEIFTLFEQVSDTVRIISFIFIFILYDPLFTSMNGGTIGHTFSKIGVRQQSDLNKNISFPAALFRFAIKYLLGWLSLLAVTSNDKKQAIHDLAVRSVVVEL